MLIMGMELTAETMLSMTETLAAQTHKLAEMFVCVMTPEGWPIMESAPKMRSCKWL
jgi:hypothetical protein